ALAMPGGSCRFDWDLASGSIRFEPCWEFGPGVRADASLPGSRPERWARLCHPDDLPLLQAALSEHFAGRSDGVACEVRVRAPAGAWRWILLQGQLAGGAGENSANRMLGLLVDVDALKRSQQMLAGQGRVLASGGVLAFTFAARPPHALVTLPGDALSAIRPASVTAGPRDPGAGTRSVSDLVAAEDVSLALACVGEAVRQPGVAAHAELRTAREGGAGAWARLRVLAPDADGEGLLHGCLIPLEDQKRAEALAAEHLAQLERVVLKTGDTQRFLEGLQHMTELLQLSENQADGYDVISQAGRHLFPRWQGAVTVAGDEGEMTVAARWGRGDDAGSPLAQGGAEDECWAVRRGRLHHVTREAGARDRGPACTHFGHGASLPPGVEHTVCVPFSMPPDRRAALHLAVEQPVDEDDLYATFWRAETLVEAMELSLANLHLRVTLREQAERDGMTGLFNRRYFDDVLPREISRARRSDASLTLVLLDIDR
ncbi:MAG: PAS domain-containing protein, partial [Gammaproteobacteria bacterium]